MQIMIHNTFYVENRLGVSKSLQLDADTSMYLLLKNKLLSINPSLN